jgi:ferredoxin
VNPVTLVNEGTTMRVEIDEPKCIAAGQCVLAASEVFDQREEDGVVILLEENPGAELHAAVRDAAALCPAAAIRLVEG